MQLVIPFPGTLPVVPTPVKALSPLKRALLIMKRLEQELSVINQ